MADKPSQMINRSCTLPHPNPGGTTSHSTKLANNASQVAGYPPVGEGTNESLRDLNVNRHIRSYVLRQGRVTVAQQRAVDNLLPVFGIPYIAEPLDLAAAFGRNAPKILEIGFGMGESTAAIAKAHPENDYLCLEVHTPGVGNLLKVTGEENISNIRIIQHDAVEVLRDMINDDTLDGVHIFFPDPWHKTRHNKRRLIQAPFVTRLVQKLKPACPDGTTVETTVGTTSHSAKPPKNGGKAAGYSHSTKLPNNSSQVAGYELGRSGGYIHVATDWENYAEQVLAVLSAEPLLQNTAEGYAPRPDYRPLTKFERRGLRLGHGVWDIVFRRL